MKRTLDCTSRDYEKASAQELKQAIKASEGRTICSEMVVIRESVGGNITNAEVARAFGADLILLNGFDVSNPYVFGLPKQEDHIKQLKKLVGRPIGINLEPVDTNISLLENRMSISAGRQASIESFKQAEKLGVDFICLTGNPATGVSTKEIIHSIKLAKENFTGLIIAGKMHSSGSDEAVCSKEIVEKYIEAGVDVVLVPAVGTVPGFSDEDLRRIVQVAHAGGVLVMSAIGTSQEGASKSVIENIAIRNKVAGVDIQHIGDSGYGGLAIVDNIFTLSVAIRGMRHTINRISISVNREISERVSFGNS